MGFTVGRPSGDDRVVSTEFPKRGHDVTTSPRHAQFIAIANSLHRRFVMTSRKWAMLSSLCCLAVAWFLLYERFPVWVTEETPLYRATRNGKEGIVTTGGRIVVPFEWERIGEFDDHGMARVVKETQEIHVNTGDPMTGYTTPVVISGVIRRDGKVIIPAELTNDSMCFNKHQEFVAVRNDQLAVFDRSGRERLGSDWTPLCDPTFGLLGLMAARNGDETGWINRAGELVIPSPPGFTPKSNFYPCGVAEVSNQQGFQGCINRDGNLVLAAEWQYVGARPSASIRDGKIVPVEPAFIRVSKANPEVSGKSLKGLFTPDGRCIVPADYADLDVEYDHEVIVAKGTNSKYGVFDFEGRVIVPFEYDHIEIGNQNHLAFAAREGRYGWIDLSGTTVIPFEYDSWGTGFGFQNGRLVIARKDKLFGAVDSNGRVVVPLEYSDAHYVSSELSVYAFCKEQKWGCFDSSGQQIIPFEYDELGLCCTGDYFTGRKDGMSYFFDQFGNRLNQAVPFRLSSMSSDVRGGDIRKILSEFDKTCRNRFLTADDGRGSGVYDINHGLILAHRHGRVQLTEFGFRGTGIAQSDAAFDQSLVWSHDHLHKLLPSLVPDRMEFEVLYDFDGNVLWRNDTRLGDFLKAIGLLCYGVYCARKSRVAARKPPLLR